MSTQRVIFKEVDLKSLYCYDVFVNHPDVNHKIGEIIKDEYHTSHWEYYPRSDGWASYISSLSANVLRQIADKVDELNDISSETPPPHITPEMVRKAAEAGNKVFEEWCKIQSEMNDVEIKRNRRKASVLRSLRDSYFTAKDKGEITYIDIQL